MTGFTSAGEFLDGRTPTVRPSQASLDAARGMLIIACGDDTHEWPLDQIRAVPDQAGQDILVLRRADDPVERLILPDRALLSSLPKPYKRVRAVDGWRILRWASAALCSVALIIFVLVPVMADQLARFIPPEGERALGEVTLEQIRAALDETGMRPIPECRHPEGRAVLDSMIARLTRNSDPLPEITVHVLDHELVNAFALPGGHVVLFEGLIDTAERPEELAAVIAHEIGHVVSRDPTRHALRSAGSIGVLGLIFGDFAGGALVLFLAERLIDAHYSQDAEAAADAFAQEMLIRAEVRPDALADMFERFRAMGGDAEGIVAHFMAHPTLGDRIENARGATPPGFPETRLMNEDDWQTLRRICR
ncbi:M48 family metallopeptidase [Cognatishimia sp. F0-27]|uniref:M48 family metallopeptidase n=1 Tax=Cognatishimia sp. F0-27 TaxID=2816855 RepID=UPI001D0CAAAB|nr:M48 family metallopeptidase [Cognatishimia sp. F0-27]MCC1491110.1 M48 family metallopeptidase [Cognatishimia sp. F0-27]